MTPAPPDRFEGVLLGCALGDALALPFEGLSSRRAGRWLGPGPLRFRLLGPWGFVSDDTEQSALVAQALVAHPGDDAAVVARFRRSLLGWFLRLPWGVGLATLRACARIAVGLRRTGVNSAGNGAAMRAALLGLVVEDAGRRRALGRALAEVTHLDARAVEGALFVAEVAHHAAHGAAREAALRAALEVVAEPSLRRALEQALALPAVTPAEAATALGHTGFVVHTLGLAAWVYAQHGATLEGAVRACIEAGGDTDTIGAIVGAWVGAGVGAAGLPPAPLARLSPGPFGPAHLRALARAAHEVALGGTPKVPGYAWPLALARNLALFPVVLAHGFRRLAPW